MSKGGQTRMNEIRDLDDKLKRNWAVVCILAFLGVGLMLVETYRLWDRSGEGDSVTEVLKMLTSLLTAWLLFFMYIYYQRLFESMKLTNALLPQDTFQNSGLLMSLRDWSFLPEALLCAVHAPPFLNFELVTYYYDLEHEKELPTVLCTDELATLFMLCARMLLVIKWVPYAFDVIKHHTRCYANLNYIEIDLWLSLRVVFWRMPLTCLLVLSSLFVSALSFAVQVAERRVNPRLGRFSNCVWMVTASMRGAAYGDLEPQTALGRAAAATSFTWGVLLAALTVIVLLRICELKKPESRVFKLLDLTDNTRMLKKRAAAYIQASWALYLERLQRAQQHGIELNAGGSASSRGRLRAEAKFSHTMRHFREMRKVLMHKDDDLSLIFKEVLDSRTRLENRIRDIDEKLEEMDAKFEHNIAAMNELLQKNLKYLKHVAS